MRVVLLGQARWTAVLASLLREHCADLVTAQARSTRQSVTLLHPNRRPDVLLRVGYRPGAPTPRGIAFDAWWAVVLRANPSVQQVMYWVGTDLVNTMADADAGRLRAPFDAAAAEMTHLAAAPWFVDELRRLGIDARPTLFPIRLPELTSPHPLPAHVSALTYLPQGRYGHYGAEMIFAAARQLADIKFVVLGSDGRDVQDVPRNVTFLGWSKSPDAAYAASSVVVRLVRHDALGATVREGLVHARHVIYNYPVPFTHTVSFGDTPRLISLLEDLQTAQQGGRLTLNLDGRSYAMAHFDPARRARRLGEELRAAAE